MKKGLEKPQRNKGKSARKLSANWRNFLKTMLGQIKMLAEVSVEECNPMSMPIKLVVRTNLLLI